MTRGGAERVPRSPAPPTPRLELGIRGPRGEMGFLLRGSFDEAMVWDLEQEIVSARRRWLDGEKGLWIATSYFDTTLDIALRFFPAVIVRYPETGEERLVHADESAARPLP